MRITKKIMILAVAMVMLLGISGQAMAYFTDGDLIQVVYQPGGSAEIATDLGALSSLTMDGVTQYGQAINFSSVFGAGVSMSSLDVAYFVTNGATAEAWVSGPTTGSTANMNKYSVGAGGMTNVENYYYNLGGGIGNSAQVQGVQSNTDSYWHALDLNKTTGEGKFAGFVNINGEQVLTALATTGSVLQYLYYYNANNDTGSAFAGTAVAQITTLANGQVELGVVATPVPATLLLFGSGLLSLVGIRRKYVA